MNKKTAIFAAGMVLSAALCSCGDNNTSSEDIKDSQQSVTEEFNDSQISEEVTSDSIENELSEDSENKNNDLRGADDFVDKEDLTLEEPLTIADFVYHGESVTETVALLENQYGVTFREINNNVKEVTIVNDNNEQFKVSARRRDGIWTLSFSPKCPHAQNPDDKPCSWSFAGFNQDISRREFYPLCDKKEEPICYYQTANEEKTSYSYVYANATLFGASPEEDSPVNNEPIQDVTISYYGVEE